MNRDQIFALAFGLIVFAFFVLVFPVDEKGGVDIGALATRIIFVVAVTGAMLLLLSDKMRGGK